ncbi:MAG: UDP-N-acetylglucosamine 2-epimerase (non-hydrolyzing) [Bacteroidales bacterium]|nr:UDP-N-acetylglucosamine 2-epimerase (non-hydrolyzing) [Bacteroidales bacterium]MDD4213406.1 UDP-N-acetylglucosamine 2-epimerase (non-hydrolyzing) [Bacteroidales bacterium]
MIKLLTIVGARPQFIKASAISRVIHQNFSDKIQEIILHTGQHYDDNMSSVFFREMEIPEPAYNLEVGSGKHGKQTAEMMAGIESILLKETPHVVLVYGDTNSTLAGALAASKMHIPLIHVEAGLRSFNKLMPEEINRIATDHVSTLMFTPTKKGIENLIKEGFNMNNIPPYHIDNPGILYCGDIMYDNALYFAKMAEEKSNLITGLKLKNENYVLVTLHRDSNTDVPEHLNSIFRAIQRICEKKDIKFVIPLHPRTRKKWSELPDDTLKNIINNNNLITIIPAVSYLDFISLEKSSRLIMTDSGGVQKESYFFKKPCLILREETEWVELLELGTAQLCGANEDKIVQSFNELVGKKSMQFPEIYGDGNAGKFILKKILEHIK